ncbi:MAG: DUF5676 family membrane protein [Candidatus Saccharibacteria bacterium]
MEMSKINFANAIAVATGVLWVICSAFVAVFPAFSSSVTKWWIHGMDLPTGGVFHLDLANFVWGGATLVFSSWVASYVLGWSLELFTTHPHDTVNKTDGKGRSL